MSDARSLKAKRAMRFQVVNEVEAKIEKIKSQLDGGGEEENRLSRWKKESVKDRWFLKYTNKKERTLLLQTQELNSKIAEENRWKSAVPLTGPGNFHCTRQRPAEETEWKRNIWPRNFYCEACLGVAGPGADVLDCRLCDIVMHYRCVVKMVGPGEKISVRDWRCHFCRESLAYDRDHYDMVIARKRRAFRLFRMIVFMFMRARHWLSKARLRIFLRRLAKAQACGRRFLSNRKVREDNKKIIRLYKVRICELCDINAMEPEPPSNTFMIVFSVINYKNPQSWDNSYIDPDKQLYYFETNSFHYGTSKINQQFLIPGSTNEVLLGVTLLRKEAIRYEFWGQAFIKGAEVLEQRAKLTLNLGDMKFEPKDKRSQIFLRNRILENKTIHGTVTVEISPCQNYASKCSYVFEVPELGSGSRSKNYRVWWAALVDSNFMLFKKYGDPHPYRTLAVLKIMWYTPAKTCIRISSMKGDDAIIFACSDPSDTSNWYNKLRQLVD